MEKSEKSLIALQSKTIHCAGNNHGNSLGPRRGCEVLSSVGSNASQPATRVYIDYRIDHSYDEGMSQCFAALDAIDQYERKTELPNVIAIGL